MKELTMPIRFSTEAANADFMRDDAETADAAEGTPPEPSKRKPERQTQHEAKGEAKPGKDTRAGIIKDQDAGKP